MVLCETPPSSIIPLPKREGETAHTAECKPQDFYFPYSKTG